MNFATLAFYSVPGLLIGFANETLLAVALASLAWSVLCPLYAALFSGQCARIYKEQVKARPPFSRISHSADYYILKFAFTLAVTSVAALLSFFITSAFSQ